MEIDGNLEVILDDTEHERLLALRDIRRDQTVYFDGKGYSVLARDITDEFVTVTIYPSGDVGVIPGFFYDTGRREISTTPGGDAGYDVSWFRAFLQRYEVGREKVLPVLSDYELQTILSFRGSKELELGGVKYLFSAIGEPGFLSCFMTCGGSAVGSFILDVHTRQISQVGGDSDLMRQVIGTGKFAPPAAIESLPIQLEDIEAAKLQSFGNMEILRLDGRDYSFAVSEGGKTQDFYPCVMTYKGNTICSFVVDVVERRLLNFKGNIGLARRIIKGGVPQKIDGMTW